MAVVNALTLELGKPPTLPGVTYGLFTTFIAVGGMRDELARHLLDAATALSDDPACLQYLVSTSGDVDVCIFEIWRDEAAHDESLLRKDVRAIVDVARPLIASVGSQVRLEVAGGKGA
jgi:quinol monooxygenase YgiN